MEKRKLPKFENEAEEARWWYENREELAKDFTNAGREGRLGPGSAARLRAKLAAKEEAAGRVALSNSSKNAA
jgi:hypothetical protein